MNFSKILYVGAGEDLSPFFKFNESSFIYVDSKPRNPYGYPYYYRDMYDTDFKQNITEKLRQNGITQISKTIFTNCFEEINVPDLDSHMVDYGRLKYYFSTSIPHENYTVFEKKIIPSISNLPDTLLVKNHHPDKDVLCMLKKPFHFIGCFPTYFPKNIEEVNEDMYLNKSCLTSIVSNDSNIVNKYTYIDSLQNIKTFSNYNDFYKQYVSDK